MIIFNHLRIFGTSLFFSLTEISGTCGSANTTMVRRFVHIFSIDGLLLLSPIANTDVRYLSVEPDYLFVYKSHFYNTFISHVINKVYSGVKFLTFCDPWVQPQLVYGLIFSFLIHNISVYMLICNHLHHL